MRRKLVVYFKGKFCNVLYAETFYLSEEIINNTDDYTQ